MTESKNVQKLEDISNEQIIEFLEKATVHHECPICDEASWGLLNKQEFLIGMVTIPKDGSFTLPPKSLPVATLQCNSCGYLRFHALGLIASKI